MAKNQTKKTNQTKSQDELISKAEAEQIVGELTADLQRLQAEFINYKRRADEERQMAVGIGKQQAAIALLPVLDNIERAISHEPEDIKDHQWVKGISSVALQLNSQLQAVGLVKVGVVGEHFNPSLHEAVVMDESDGDIEVVAEVLQTGYKFGDTVIRPAMVKVTRRKS